jgi:hypothetical protein
MMENEHFEPVQSLRLIESMINKAKNRFGEDGHLYLLWGWVILACSLLHFVFIEFNVFERPEWVWGFTWLAFIYQAIYLGRKRKQVRVSTYTDEILKAIWLVFVGCGILLGLVAAKSGNWMITYPLILMLYGVPTILSGTVLRFRPLVAGGIVCWVLSVLSLFLSLQYNLLMIALAVIAAWIIPGYLMKQKFSRENV